jgi:phage terminase small subunit
MAEARAPKTPSRAGAAERRALFVAEYLKDFNATRAALAAGFAKASAKQQAFNLLQRPDVAAAVQQAIAERSERTKIDADWVLRQAVKLHERCMDEGVFNPAGAAKALELVGKHVGVQAFKEKVEHDVRILHEDALDELG